MLICSSMCTIAIGKMLVKSVSIFVTFKLKKKFLVVRGTGANGKARSRADVVVGVK